MTTAVSATRVSNTLLSQLAMRNISQNMNSMLELQYQLASGLRLYKTSIDPAGAAVAMSFQNITERREQATTNISRSNEFLVATDGALSDLQDLLNQAAEIASTNIGAGTDDDSRQNAATVVSSLISQLTQLGNRQYQERYLFAGRATDQAPFGLSSTSVYFAGDIGELYTIIDSSSTIRYNVTAEEAFGTLSGQVTSTSDLNPAITLATRLAHLNGGDGVRAGTIELSDGVTTTQIDLSYCDTVADVVNAINANGVVSVTAAINAAGNGLVIQADPGDAISVTDLPGGYAARDLGILQETALPAGTDLVGTDLDRLMTLTTELSALRGGTGIDQVSGLLLGVGDDSATIDLSAAVTVQDLLNAVNFCGLHAKAEIDDAGRRLVVSNAMASENMYIGENGGTTAVDLGVRSMTLLTPLSSLNCGQGVRTVSGADDFNITTRDGSVIGIDASSATLVAHVVATINADPANGGRVTASLNPVGNGICLTDNTAGGGNFQVTRANSSLAAADLGIEAVVPNPGNVINGEDVAPVAEQGIFRLLFDLREALLANDSSTISTAGAGIQSEVGRVARIRGTVGVRMQALDQAERRIENELTQVKGLLSEVRDLDYASAVSRLQTLQTTFEASLQASASILPLSLMDFLSL